MEGAPLSGAQEGGEYFVNSVNFVNNPFGSLAQNSEAVNLSAGLEGLLKQCQQRSFAFLRDYGFEVGEDGDGCWVSGSREDLRRLSFVLSLRRRIGQLRKAERVFHVLVRAGFRVVGIGLTFRRLEDFHKGAIRGYLNRLVGWLKRKGVRRYFYAWVMEVQQRGVPHYHILLAYEGRIRIPFPDQSWWSYGSSNLQVLAGRSLMRYLAKYFEKELENAKGYQVSWDAFKEVLRQFKGVRKFGFGGWGSIRVLVELRDGAVYWSFECRIVPFYVAVLAIGMRVKPQRVRLGERVWWVLGILAVRRDGGLRIFGGRFLFWVSKIVLVSVLQC
jgi:hypothetical protein